MRPVLLQGGWVVDPASEREELADVLLREGCVAAVGRGLGTPDDALVIDCRGKVVAPGLIDLHCHLRDPGLTEKETIATGTAAAAAGGFTTVCCMPNTDPVVDSGSVVESILRTAAREGSVRVLPIGAVTKGQAGRELAELADLAAAGAVAFSDDGRPVASAALLRHALEYSQLVQRPIIDHCEEPSLTVGAVAHEGPVATCLGLRGWPAAAETIAIARDLELAALTGGRLHIAHVSTAGGVALIREAKRRGLPVTAEVTPHHLTLTDEWLLGEGLHWPALGGEPLPRRAPYDPRTKVNPPLRGREDVAALIAALADGTIDAIATDHAPHTLTDKLCEYDQAAFGISGLETALAAVLALVRSGALSLRRVIAAFSIGPRQVLGEGARAASPGRLAPGDPADVVVFDPDASWVVDPHAFRSKGQNTPLAGVRLQGRVTHTFVAGRGVHGE
ncbi:MAG: dihydroorotase [Chloroflexi bacterium]|nr:dihydroorotase [Chloroflexota bacterium]